MIILIYVYIYCQIFHDKNKFFYMAIMKSELQKKNGLFCEIKRLKTFIL